MTLLARRLKLIDEIVELKQLNRLPVIDQHREHEMLAAIELVAASEGLEPAIARSVLRAVIDAFAALEHDRIGETP